MEIPTKFKSVLAGFRYWLLAFIFLASSAMLISCSGSTTVVPPEGGVGGADTLVINAPSSVETGQEGTISVLATAAGATVNGETLTFQINPNQSGSSLSATSVTTVNGVASVTYTGGIFNIPASDTITVAGTNDFYTLPDGSCTTDSTLPGAVLGCTFAIGVIVPGLDAVAVTAIPTTLEAIAGGTKNQGIIEALVTATGTPLEGVSVNFTTTGGSICDLGASPCTGQQVSNVQTDPSGIARITIQSSTLLETATVTAQAGFIFGSADVTFIAGPADSFSLFANPVNITADGFSTSKVTALVRDEAGHIVADGATVNFSVNTTSSTGTGAFTDIPPSDDTVGGLASSTFTAGTTFGFIDVDVSSGGASDTATQLITLIQETVGNVSVVVEPDSLIANGAADNTVVVRATLTNSSGFPMNAGTPVTISTTGGLLDFVSPIASGVTSLLAYTDNTGAASVFLQSNTIAGLYSVNATSGGRVGQDEVTFVAGPTDPVTSQLTVSPTTIPADGATTATMTLTARDANNNLVANGKPVQFQAVNDPGVGISGATDTSDGIATATLTSSTTPGTVDLQAIIDGQTVTGCPSCATPVAQTQITFGATALGNPNSIVLNLTGGSDADPPDNPGSGTTLTVESPGGSNAIKIEATVNDTSGSPIGVDCTDNITFAVIAGPGDIKLDGIAVASVDKTTEAGVASVSLSAGTTPGTVRIQVTATQNSSTCVIDGGETTVTATTTAITIGSGPAATLVIYPEANLIDEPDSSLTSWIFNAIVTDIHGNPVQDGTAVSFSLASSAAGAQVCPEGFTGTLTEDTDCAGETTAINGVARTKLTWPPELIWAEDFILEAETSGDTVGAFYPSQSWPDVAPATAFDFPAVSPIAITVEMLPDTLLKNGTADVKITYTDGSKEPTAIPIAGRGITLSADNAIVTTLNDPGALTDSFGVTVGDLAVGCDAVEGHTVTITAVDNDPGAPYSGTGTFNFIKADVCP